MAQDRKNSRNCQQALDQRVTTLDQRMGALEQAIYGIINELGRGFGQQQQQITRLEKRIDAVDVGLTGLREAIEARIIAAMLRPEAG